MPLAKSIYVTKCNIAGRISEPRSESLPPPGFSEAASGSFPYGNLLSGKSQCRFSPKSHHAEFLHPQEHFSRMEHPPLPTGGEAGLATGQAG